MKLARCVHVVFSQNFVITGSLQAKLPVGGMSLERTRPVRSDGSGVIPSGKPLTSTYWKPW